MILLDTNILVYATDETAEHHVASSRLLDAVIEGRVPGVILPQNLVEFIGVVTGSSAAAPLQPAQAVQQAEIFRSQIRTLSPPLASLDELSRIVEETGRAARRVFDYYLAAQCRALGIQIICTYNIADFAGISGLRALLPAGIDIPNSAE